MVSLKAVSTTVTWKDVAAWFGVIGLVTLGFAIRSDEIKSRPRRPGDLRFLLGFLGCLYFVWLIIGIVMIVKVAGG